MSIFKSIPVNKVIHNTVMTVSETAIISENQYNTHGESFIVVKDVPLCKIKLDSKTTEHITIKALTSVIIIPDNNSIDEEYDEINIEKGACVEFRLLMNNWYIMSSDGLKLS
jgi:hypothetical protein